jgi:hypothetical protein
MRRHENRCNGKGETTGQTTPDFPGGRENTAKRPIHTPLATNCRPLSDRYLSIAAWKFPKRANRETNPANRETKSAIRELNRLTMEGGQHVAADGFHGYPSKPGAPGM